MTPTSEHASPSRRVLPLIYAVTLTGILSNSLLAPVIPDILDDFDQPDSAAGRLVAVGSMPGIVIAPLVGILADRLGRRNVLVPGLVVFGVFGIIAATAPTFSTLLLARFGMGFGSAAMINLAVVLIGDYFPDPATRTKIIGRNSSVLTVGLALIPLTSGVVTDLASWRWGLAIYAFALITAVAAWRLLDPGRPPSVGTVREQLSGAGAALRNPVIATTLVTGALLFALVFGVFLTVFPNHLEGEFDLSAGWRGLLIALPAIPSTFMAFNLGRINGRFGRAATVLVCSFAWAVAFAIIAASPMLAMLIAGTLLYGAGEGGLIPSLQDVAVSEAPDEHRGAVVAVWVGAARLGQTLGPLAAGALLAAASTTVALWAGAGLAAVLMVMLALSPLVRGAPGAARGATT